MTPTVMSVLESLGPRPGRLFINGQWMDGDGERLEQIHPANNRVMTTIEEAGQRGADLAVAAARRAFDEGPWPRMPAQDRKRILQRVVERIYEAEEEIAKLQTLDNGVPYSFSRNARLSPRAAADHFDHYVGWIDKINGETYPQFSSASNTQFMTFREPVGVVAAILAWNAPLILFVHKVAAALACGCTVVVKPSEFANMAVTKLAQILAESDLPPGVFNLVTGSGATGAAMVSHPVVDKVTFTGSAETGERIYRAGGSNMKRLSLELGGKSAALVFPDVRNLAAAANTLMGLCSTFMSGQICSTQTRALVHRSVLDEFVHHASEQVKKVRFGDPFDPMTTSAPMISKRQVEKVLGFVRSGQEEGGRLVFGGDRPGGALSEGNWVNPAMFVDVHNGMRVAREEIFGPVLCVIPFDTEEEAVRIANDSEYGLTGSIYTTDITRAFRVARSIRSGSVGINGYSASANSPMGGVKRSGVGREGGWPSIESFTELKTVSINLDA